jgi:hypothetical protein
MEFEIVNFVNNFIFEMKDYPGTTLLDKFNIYCFDNIDFYNKYKNDNFLKKELNKICFKGETWEEFSKKEYSTYIDELIEQFIQTLKIFNNQNLLYQRAFREICKDCNSLLFKKCINICWNRMKEELYKNKTNVYD